MLRSWDDTVERVVRGVLTVVFTERTGDWRLVLRGLEVETMERVVRGVVVVTVVTDEVLILVFVDNVVGAIGRVVLEAVVVGTGRKVSEFTIFPPCSFIFLNNLFLRFPLV